MKKSYHIQNAPFVVPTTDGKVIEEHWGRATDGNQEISIAHMVAPSGWSEPFQTPEFDEYTYICLLYTSPSPRDLSTSRMPSSA